MAELLTQILQLPEDQRIQLIEAVIKSLDPQTSIFIRQAMHAERHLIEWEESGTSGYSQDEILSYINQLRSGHKKAG